MKPTTKEAISILRKAKKAKIPRFSEQDLRLIFDDIRQLSDEALLAPEEKKPAKTKRLKDPLVAQVEAAFKPITGSSQDKALRFGKAIERRGDPSHVTSGRTLGALVKSLRKSMTDQQIAASAEAVVLEILAADDMQEAVN